MGSKADIEEVVVTIKNLNAGVTGVQIANAMSVIEDHRELNPYFQQYIGRTLKQYERFLEDSSEITGMDNKYVPPSSEETPDASMLHSRFEGAQSWKDIYQAFVEDEEGSKEGIEDAFERIMRGGDRKAQKDTRPTSKDDNIYQAREERQKVIVRRHFRKVVEKTLEKVNGYQELMQEADNFELTYIRSLWKRVTLDNILLLFAGVPVQQIVNGTSQLFQAMQGVNLGNQNMLQLFGASRPLLTNVGTADSGTAEVIQPVTEEDQ